MLRQKSPRRPMPPKAITINEIAREAGVSTATVSRVFNQPAKVKKQTRERVSAVINRHHYVSHGLAGGLGRVVTFSWARYTDGDQFHLCLVHPAVHHAAQRAGYTSGRGGFRLLGKREAELIHQLVSRRVEGLILTGEQRSPAVTRRFPQSLSLRHHLEAYPFARAPERLIRQRKGDPRCSGSSPRIGASTNRPYLRSHRSERPRTSVVICA